MADCNLDNLKLETAIPTGTATTTTLESSLNPSDFGDNVTFTATIKEAGVTATAATGTVEFKVDGTVVEAAAAISSGVASYSSSSLSVGPHTVVAIYSGDSTYQAIDQQPAHPDGQQHHCAHMGSGGQCWQQHGCEQRGDDGSCL